MLAIILNDLQIQKVTSPSLLAKLQTLNKKEATKAAKTWKSTQS